MTRHVALVVVALSGCVRHADEGVDVDSDAQIVDTDPPRATLAAPSHALVGESVTLDAGTAGEASRWDFGDGSRQDRAPGLAATHVYDRPGMFRVSVEVFGAGDASDVAEATITVTWPLLATPPRASSSIVTTDDRAFVALPDFDAVAVVDLASGEALDPLRPCPRPRRLSLAPGDGGAPGLLAVSCEETTPGVALYDVTSEAVTPRATLDLTDSGRSPFGVVVGADRVTWVTARGRGDDGGVILAVDDEGRIVDEHAVGDDLRGLAWAGDALYASRFRSPDDGGLVYQIGLPGFDVAPWVLPVDTIPDSDVHSRGVPTYVEPLAVRPDGRVLAFGGLKANVLRGPLRDGQALTQESTVRAELGALAVHPDEGAVGGLLGEARLDNLDLVGAIAYHPSGDLLYATLRGNRAVVVVDAVTLGFVAARLDVADVLDGLAVTPDGTRLLVVASVDRTVTVFDARDHGSPPLATIDLTPAGGEVLDADVLEGARIFATAADPRMTRDAYISCASCHLDAEHDGRVWDFTSRGEGLRNTISLHGMADRVGLPIHWSGNFDEIQDFEADVRGPQAGTGFLSDALYAGPAGPTLGEPKAGLSVELDQLAAYVAHFRDLDVPWDADVSEGEAIFEAAGCAECHPAGGSTSSWEVATPPRFPRLVDVGTIHQPESGHRLGGDLPGLDVPSLHGVWATAPYLHDGSAATLADVVRPCADAADRGCNLDDRHGITSDLDASEAAALVRYLRSL